MVSLGCENNDLEHFLPVLGEIDESRVKMMVTQDVEGDELEYGMELIRELAQELSQDQREDVPVSKTKKSLFKMRRFRRVLRSDSQSPLRTHCRLHYRIGRKRCPDRGS